MRSTGWPRAKPRCSDERETSELREQFIAVLGHDLRNPLAAIRHRRENAAKARRSANAAFEIARMIQKSVGRMSALIDNVLDFARGRLGGGIAARTLTSKPLGRSSTRSSSELRTSSTGPGIEAEFDLPGNGRLRRRAHRASCFRTCSANAITHGGASAPVRVRAATKNGRCIRTYRSPIPASRSLPIAHGAAVSTVLSRRRRRIPIKGALGLGLYIASEIARAHDGTIDATSSPEETRFTFRMPLGWNVALRSAQRPP